MLQYEHKRAKTRIKVVKNYKNAEKTGRFIEYGAYRTAKRDIKTLKRT